MFTDLSIFRLSSATAHHTGMQQARIAQNIANADTPGFKAHRVTRFSEVYHRGTTGADRITDNASPNGNTVSLEEQMVHAANTQKDHEQALAVYRHGLTLLRATLGRR